MSLLWRMAFLLLILLSPGHADDRGRIEACLDERSRSTDFPQRLRDCIGITLDECIAQPGGDTTIGMVDCLQAEGDAWDDLLNVYYNRARDGLSQELANGLRDVQRAWIAYRDLSCRLSYDMAEGGSIRGPLAAECRLTKTAEQALWLRGLGYEPL